MAIDGLKQFLPQTQSATANLVDYKVYDAILELQRKVQELTGYASGLENTIIAQQIAINGLRADIEDLENRVTDLENQL